VTFQFVGTLRGRSAEPSEAVFSTAMEATLKWVAGKFAGTLPPEGLAGDSFDAEITGQVVRCIALREQGLWTLRLVQPDAPYQNQRAVAGRTWSTDVSIAREDDVVRVGVRVVCASLPYATDAIRLTRPYLLVELAETLALFDTRHIEPTPWHLSTTDDLRELRAVLTSSRRTLPVYVLTQPDKRRLEVETREFLLDAELLARRTFGMAYVVTMPPALSFEWTEMVGKPWSVYLGAVRTYRPNLSFEEDALFQHPRILAERVLAFAYNGLKSEEAFTQLLVDQAHRHAAQMRVDWGPLRLLEDARVLQAELARQQASDDEGRVSSLLQEVEALKAKIAGIEDERELALQMAADHEFEKNQAKDISYRVQVQLDALRRAYQDISGVNPDAALEIPATYEALPEWLRENFSGRLALHSRAERGLADAVYEDAALVGQALVLLATEYRRMQLGEPGANEAFLTGCRELGLDFGRSISRERAGEQGETYFLRFPRDSPERRFLEFHLRKGTGRDARHCLAIYFFWDEDTEQVVVGWLPSHLDNRLT
jgi:hypothetical protein